MSKSNVYRVYVDDDGKIVCPKCLSRTGSLNSA